MKLKNTLLAGLLSCFSLVALAQPSADYNIIPLPQSVQLAQGEFLLKDGVQVTYPVGNELMKNNAELRAQLSQQQEQLIQKDAQLSAAIKALSATNSAEQIAKILDVSKQQVEMILKD